MTTSRERASDSERATDSDLPDELAPRLDQLKTQFFANISNEFRTPLALMLGPLEDELAETGAVLPPGRRARLVIAHRNGLRLQRMVNTLLEFSHIEAGRMQASFEPIDLAALTEELANIIRAPIENAGLRLSTRLEPLPEPIYVDREMWAKIVLNLLSNALKHTFKGGITLSLFASSESTDHVELHVDDTGTGIPASELPRLFQRFHKVKGARSRSDEGTGIGLAVVRALTGLHGGDVGVTSREGLGSSFWVRLRRGCAHLPVAQVVGSPRAPAADATQLTTYVEDALRWSKTADASHVGMTLDIDDADADRPPAVRSKVLWAESHADTRSYVARLLTRTYDVTALANDDELFRALDTPFDLIVLGEVSGRDRIELLRELRTGQHSSLTPVLLLLAHATEDAGIECLDAGADDYLIKPFSSKALLARVRSSLALAKLRRESEDKLAEAYQELEAFSYSVSHDLRAPLRAIDGFSKALLTGYADRLDDEGRRYLDRVRNATQRMAQLIDDLLSLSRITRAAMRRERVDLTSTARKVLSELAVRDPDRRVETIVSDGLAGQGDGRLITVVFENLLGNAWKFTSRTASARIEVGGTVKDGEAVFFVRDNGAGFSMEYANKLFTPFQRLHSASVFPGTGIGLATVQRVVKRHGGRIWTEAAPDEGAAFFFTLGHSP